MAINIDCGVFAVLVLLLLIGCGSTAPSKHTGPTATDKTHESASEILEEIRILRHEVITLQSTDKQREADMIELKERLSNVEQVQENLQEMYDNLRTSHDNLHVQHSILQVKHDDLQTKHDDIRTKHDNVQAKYDDLKANHDHLQTKHDDVVAKHIKSTSHLSRKLGKSIDVSENRTMNVHGQHRGVMRIQSNRNREDVMQPLDDSNILNSDLATGVVAFFAKIAGFAGSPTERSTIPFDVVQLNIGNAYDSGTGEFEVPVAGVYTFSYLALADDSCGDNFVCTTLQVSGATISRACSDQIVSAGGSVAIQLDVGDSVSVVLEDWPTCQTLEYGADLFNTFSGHLVYQII